MLLSIALTFLTLITSTYAARLSVLIQSSPQLLNPSSLPPSTHAVLLGPPGVRYDVPLRRDNTFVFPDLAEASYLLTIHTLHWNFQPLRVDVTKAAGGEQTISAWQTFRGNEWSNKGPQIATGEGQLQLQVRPTGQREFYEKRQGFNLLAFLKSPMILMALVSAAMIFGMPYLMDNMDEETKKDLEEMQKKGPVMGADGAASQIQNFDLAGWMAGKQSGSRGSTPTPGSGGGEGKKKR